MDVDTVDPLHDMRQTNCSIDFILDLLPWVTSDYTLVAFEYISLCPTYHSFFYEFTLE